jgi:hypothetical protein
MERRVSAQMNKTGPRLGWPQYGHTAADLVLADYLVRSDPFAAGLQWRFGATRGCRLTDRPHPCELVYRSFMDGGEPDQVLLVDVVRSLQLASVQRRVSRLIERRFHLHDTNNWPDGPPRNVFLVLVYVDTGAGGPPLPDCRIGTGVDVDLMSADAIIEDGASVPGWILRGPAL